MEFIVFDFKYVLGRPPFNVGSIFLCKILNKNIVQAINFYYYNDFLHSGTVAWFCTIKNIIIYIIYVCLCLYILYMFMYK